MSNMYEIVSIKQNILDIVGRGLSKTKVNILHNFSGIESYQPLFMKNGSASFIFGKKAKREDYTRYGYVINKVKDCMSNTGMYLDIGSQYGYLPLSIGAEGYWCFGVELQKSAASLSIELARLNNVRTVFFLNANLNEVIEGMPTFDVVSMLSVFHHIVAGLDDRQKSIILLDKILEKVNKRVIVELADGKNENHSWSRANIELCEDESTEEWYKNLFEARGFKIVDMVEFETHLGSIRKTLVADRIVVK